MSKRNANILLGLAGLLALSQKPSGETFGSTNKPQMLNGLHVFISSNWKTIKKDGLKPKQNKVYIWNTNDQGEKSAEAFARYLCERLTEQNGEFTSISLVEINLRGLEDKIRIDHETDDMGEWFPHEFERGEFGEGYFIETEVNIEPERLTLLHPYWAADEQFSSEESSEEDSSEEGFGEDDIVKDIPITSLSMLESQGIGTLQDIWRGELSMSKGLPVLFYDTKRKQLIVEDGNHRIFQKWLNGEDTFDAYVYEGIWHEYLRPVYQGEKVFDWDEEYREKAR